MKVDKKASISKVVDLVSQREASSSTKNLVVVPHCPWDADKEAEYQAKLEEESPKKGDEVVEVLDEDLAGGAVDKDSFVGTKKGGDVDLVNPKKGGELTKGDHLLCTNKEGEELEDTNTKGDDDLADLFSAGIGDKEDELTPGDEPHTSPQPHKPNKATEPVILDALLDNLDECLAETDKQLKKRRLSSGETS
ncbi:unnamed protein product, partial [Amoebophrya sp. A25]|eukprot:GSA25T00019484001.1